MTTKSKLEAAASLARAEEELIAAQGLARAVYRRIREHEDADRIEEVIAQNAHRALERVRKFMLTGFYAKDEDGKSISPEYLKKQQTLQESELQQTLEVMGLRIQQEPGEETFQVLDKDGQSTGE